ncbi:hypothetical protein, partial [Cohnella soli]
MGETSAPAASDPDLLKRSFSLAIGAAVAGSPDPRPLFAMGDAWTMGETSATAAGNLDLLKAIVQPGVVFSSRDRRRGRRQSGSAAAASQWATPGRWAGRPRRLPTIRICSKRSFSLAPGSAHAIGAAVAGSPDPQQLLAMGDAWTVGRDVRAGYW